MKDLEKQREDCEEQLQKQISGHFRDFIQSTKHIQQLEQDMLQLRKNVTEQQHIMFNLTSLDHTGSSHFVNKLRALQSEQARWLNFLLVLFLLSF